jgi:hypothetical protein
MNDERAVVQCVHGHQRMNREIEMSIHLEHPNVAKFYGVSFALGGEPAMVMQWYRNGTVRDFVKDRDIFCRLSLVCQHPTLQDNVFMRFMLDQRGMSWGKISSQFGAADRAC